MKKLICVLLLLGVVNSSYSQMQKGNIMFGLSGSYYNSDGNLSFDNSQITTPSSNINKQIQANIRMGFMVTDRIAVGGIILYGLNSQDYVSYNNFGVATGTNQKQENYGFGVLGRFYKMFGEGKV